ncbi:MAG: hypothetical protein ACO3L0_01040 [Vulcanococcus sp.]
MSSIEDASWVRWTQHRRAGGARQSAITRIALAPEIDQRGWFGVLPLAPTLSLLAGFCLLGFALLQLVFRWMS